MMKKDPERIEEAEINKVVLGITAVRLTEGSSLGDRLIDWVCGGRWAVST